jgi:hypothetical protein
LLFFALLVLVQSLPPSSFHFLFLFLFFLFFLIASSLGTFDNFNHLYLPAEDFDYISYRLSDLVNRIFATPTPSISVLTESNYWEADIFGNVLFPEAVKFVIADLSALFGQSQGTLLQNWCRGTNLLLPLLCFCSYFSSSFPSPSSQLSSDILTSPSFFDLLFCSFSSFLIEMGWPLVWAQDSVQITWLTGKNAFNASFFDPTILTPFSNVTSDNITIASFNKLWDSTNATVAFNPFVKEYQPFWTKVLFSFFRS